MWSNLPLFPERASTVAGSVDALYAFLVLVSTFFSVLIFVLLFYFAIKYRRRSDAERPAPNHGDLRLEFLWIVVPLGLTMIMFIWGAKVFFHMSTPPTEAIEIAAVGKQWMWKFQHPSGHREINELHVPVDRAVKLTMSSEDVLHAFYVPAFRVKMDVLPGRFTTVWFEATKTGAFHLFCAEYCGTVHAGMIGKVIVMTPADYERWLSGDAAGETMAETGAKLFEQLACHTCHSDQPDARGPSLTGIFGREVSLQDGSRVLADENYLRQSILAPNAKIVEGYRPIMPTFQGQISEAGLMQIVAYIRSLSGREGNMN
jgi:cytochrome c oxidase subunit 2